jgi:hypothetical protein
MPENEPREPLVSEEEHDGMNRLGEVSFLEGLEEAKTGLEVLI